MVSKHTVKFTDNGRKSLKKIGSADAKRILKKLKKLEQFSSRTRNIKRMKGSQGQVYRLRVGDMRVLFKKQNSTIWIFEVGYRGLIY